MTHIFQLEALNISANIPSLRQTFHEAKLLKLDDY